MVSKPFSRIGNIRPAYPVKPVQPSKEDRRPGRRRKPLPQQEPHNDTVDDANDDEEDNRPLIDEYI